MITGYWVAWSVGRNLQRLPQIRAGLQRRPPADVGRGSWGWLGFPLGVFRWNVGVVSSPPTPIYINTAAEHVVHALIALCAHPVDRWSWKTPKVFESNVLISWVIFARSPCPSDWVSVPLDRVCIPLAQICMSLDRISMPLGWVSVPLARVFVTLEWSLCPWTGSHIQFHWILGSLCLETRLASATEQDNYWTSSGMTQPYRSQRIWGPNNNAAMVHGTTL